MSKLWLSLGRTVAAALVLTAVSACSGIGTPSISPGQNSMGASLMPLKTLKLKDFTFVNAGPGTPGALVTAKCPAGARYVVAGGANSANGKPVGTGSATKDQTGWVAGGRDARAIAYATCVSSAAQGLFKLVIQTTANGPDNTRHAQCGSGWQLITGYGGNPEPVTWFDPKTNTFSVRGGGIAYAECVMENTGVSIKNSGIGSGLKQYAPCGKDNTVIGGAGGSSDAPGPPDKSYPATTNDKAGHTAWWTHTTKGKMKTWAACVADN